jgi:hypothetical protein
MKVFLFLVCFAIFVGALLLMGYAFSVPEAWGGPMFFAGILAVVVAFSIPFHLLSRTD